jgi:hypothetical protein
MNTTTPSHGFTEQAFSALATAIDEVPAERREVFLVQLVILLSARSSDPDTLGECISRARDALTSV